TGTIPTVDNSHLPFGPAVTRIDSIINAPITSDGRFIYFVIQQKSPKYGTFKHFVDVYDPCAKMVHVKRIKLRYPESSTLLSSLVRLLTVVSKGKNISMASVLNPKCLGQAAFYTNGHYLMVVLPPPFGTDYNYDSKTHVCRSFSLRDGSLIGNF